LYENLPDGVIGTDTNGLITFCNSKVLEMFQYENEKDVIGRRIDEFLHPDYKEPAMDVFRTSLAEGKTKLDGFEGIGIRSDKSEIYFHMSSSIIKVDDIIVGFQSHIRDLSDWKVNQELLKLQREELSKFAHTMAHDLRSSIQVITGLAELYQMDRTEKHLTDIIGIAGKMDAILSNSVTLAEAGIIIGPKSYINFQELVHEVAATSIPDEIQIEHDDLPSLNCDRAKMVQVIQNLMNNAHEHGNASIINIDTKKETDTCSISFSNNGVPIPSTEAEIAKRLETFANKIGGREQLAIESFAEALRIVPKTLAENGGHDPIDIIADLNKDHSTEAGLWSGVDVAKGKTGNMMKGGVIEPARVKSQAIRAAAEAAQMILRIDDVIAAKATAGPPPGMGGGGMPGGMGGMPGMGM
ncbi:MAG: TCP-1/cpn60 chaperonin family protein, partial [Candidatus Thorarchaeota archaeon]